MSNSIPEEVYAQYDINRYQKKLTYTIQQQVTQTSSDTSVIYRYSHKQHCFVRSSEVQRVQFHFQYDGPYQFGGSIQIVPKKRDIFNIQNKSVQTDDIRQISVRVDTDQKIIKEVSGSFSRSQIYDAYFAKKPAQSVSPAELAEQARRRKARLLDALVLAETLLCEKAAPPAGFLALMNTISPPKYDYWVQHYLETQKIDEFSNTQYNLTGMVTELSDTMNTDQLDHDQSGLKTKQTIDSSIFSKNNTIDVSEQQSTQGLYGQNQSEVQLQRIETLQLRKQNVNNIPQTGAGAQNTSDSTVSYFANNLLSGTNDDLPRQISPDSYDLMQKTQKSMSFIKKPAATAVCLGSEYLVSFGALLQVYSRLNTFHAAAKHHFAQEITCICQIGSEASEDEMNAGLILIGLRDGNLVLLDRNLQQLDEEHFHEGAVSAVQKKPSTNLFVSVCMGGVICFSRVTDGKIYLIYKTELPGVQILSLFLGRLHFAVGTDQGSVVQFEYYRKTALFTYSQEDGLSPTFYYGIGEVNGELVVCGEDGVMRAVRGGHEVFMADQPLYSVYGLRHGRSLLQGQSVVYLLQSTTEEAAIQGIAEPLKQIDKTASTSSLNLINTLETASKSFGISVKLENDSSKQFQSLDEYSGFKAIDLLKDDPLSLLYDQQDNNMRPNGLKITQHLEILDFIEVQGMTRITVNLDDDIALIGTETGGVMILKIGQDLQVAEQSTRKQDKKHQMQQVKKSKSRAAMLTGRMAQVGRNLLPNADTHDLLTGPEDGGGVSSGLGSTTTGSTYVSKSIFTRVLQ